MFKKFLRFFDDPVSKFIFFYFKMAQRQFRKAIDTKYKNEVPNQVYWIPNTEEENLGLSDNKVEYIAQRLTLSQASYFIAHRLWAKIRYIITPIFFIFSLCLAYVFFEKSDSFSSENFQNLAIGLTLFFAFIVGFGGYLLAPFTAQIFLPNTAYTKEEIDNIEDTVKRCIVKDIDKDTPSDFKDRLRTLDIDSEGRSVAGQILALDFEKSALFHEWTQSINKLLQIGLLLAIPALMLISPIFGILATIIFSYQLAPKIFETPIGFFIFVLAIPTIFSLLLTNQVPIAQDYFSNNPTNEIAKWLLLIYGWVGFFASVLRDESPLAERAFMLEQSVKQTGTEFLIDRVGRKYFSSLEEAKKAQIENVKKDKSPFIKLGKTTGILSDRRDPLAPSESGIDFGLSINDLSTHLFVLGASGTGKTTGVIRPVTHNWLAVDGGGLLVLDGKGALPLELKNDQYDYHLISPTSDKFNPIDGMNPDSVADTLVSIFGGNSSDPFWENSAGLMLRMACAIIYFSSKPFTLNEIYTYCTTSNEERFKLFEDSEFLKSIENDNNLAYSAFVYWRNDFPTMPEKTSGSIVNMVRTWLGNIVSNEKLGSWVNTDKSVKIEDVFTGKKMGLLMPESEYGLGGIAISALVMRRLYDSAKKRGDNWQKDPSQKPVLMVADEIQNLLSDADIENVAIARSLGLYLNFATQNIDGLYKKLDKDGAIQMLGNFASFIALPPRTKDSNEYISNRASKIWKSVVERFDGLPDSRADINLYLESGADRNLRKTRLFNTAFIGSPRRAYLLGDYEERTDPNTGEITEEWTQNNSASPSVNIQIETLIDPDEIDTLLAKPQTAIALVNRGRVQRRDVIELGLMGGK